MLHLERGYTRPEYAYEYSYNRYIIIAAVPHIPISLNDFGGVACRIPFASRANTPKAWWEGNLLFLGEGK